MHTTTAEKKYFGTLSEQRIACYTEKKKISCIDTSRKKNPVLSHTPSFVDHITPLTYLQEFAEKELHKFPPIGQHHHYTLFELHCSNYSGFARKTLNNGSAKTSKASYEDEKHRENSVSKIN